MRILMLTYCYPPLIGGIEQYVANLSIELIAHGHDVTVVTMKHQNLPAFEIDRGVRIYRISGTVHRIEQFFIKRDTRLYAPPAPDPGLVWALRQIIAKEQPDIVHAHNWLVHSFLPLKIWSKAKLVVTLHDYELRCAKWFLMYRGEPCNGPGVRKCLECTADHYSSTIKGAVITFGNWIMSAIEKKMVDMFLPVSRAVAKHSGLTDHKYPYQIITNFVPDNIGTSRQPMDPCVEELPDDGYLLYVGALTKIKGIHVLLCAYAEISNPPPLVVIGSTWPDTPSSVPANVILLKNWPHSAIMEAWRQSMIALAPSVSPDSCPTVAIEAAVSGKPIIASDIGGLSDLVIDGKTGILVPPGDPVALYKAIERLLLDVELRERMAQAAKLNAELYKASAVVSQIEQVYERITA